MNRDDEYREFIHPAEDSRTLWIDESIARDMSKLNRIWERQLRCKSDSRKYRRLEKKGNILIDRITEKGEQNAGYDPMWLLYFFESAFAE